MKFGLIHFWETHGFWTSRVEIVCIYDNFGKLVRSLQSRAKHEIYTMYHSCGSPLLSDDTYNVTGTKDFQNGETNTVL